MVETSDEWIRERTGIGERHVSVGETVVTLASEAARKALEQAGKRAEEIDLIPTENYPQENNKISTGKTGIIPGVSCG